MNKPILPPGAGSQRPQVLNYREVYPAESPRHPHAIARCPQGTVAVLWLDTAGNQTYPRFAFLDYNRAQHLFNELGRILRGGAGPGATERARRMLRGVDVGEASGA